MAFVRIKKIKHHHYAYLVENQWKRNTSRQKVKDYLGRVIELPEGDVPFPGGVKDLSFEEGCQKIIDWMLQRYGFTCNEHQCTYEDYHYDKRNHQLTKSGKPVVIKSYDGYLNQWSIKQLLDFQPEGTEEEIAYDLAKAFVDSGLFVPKDVFVEMFQKVYDVKEAMHR